ncbi:MAG TPA: PBP1A family penicillin-binding protein, partial [archaeon]|nr:PBP1A family penicillin-binding protein [archaeon]
MAFGLSLTAGLLVGFLWDLPNPTRLEEYQPSVATILYTDQDEPFHSFYEQRRILVPLAKIPALLIQAVLAVEDSRFYEHHGLSPRAIVRALFMNVLAGRKAQGGSTITQQLARRLFLTPEKSLPRKIKEMLLALEIERRYSKAKILELYLNLVYFGHGAYGVEAAAQTYFQKSVGDLTLPEVAMLAGLPSAPNRFSPIINPAQARQRRDHVLNRMVHQGYITQAQADVATRTPFDESLFTRQATTAPYFVEHVRQQLEETYGAYALYNTGLKVYTTLNLKMQRSADEALIGGLRELDKRTGYRLSPAHAEAMRGRVGPYTPKSGEILPGTVLRVNPNSAEIQLGRYRGEIAFASLKWTKLARPADAFKEGGSVLVRVVSVNEGTQRVELALEQDPELEGAFLALDPRDGSIKAMIGGYDFTRSKFNRAIQAKRQPGSAFKPFIYAAAFDRGLTPSTVIDDSPISIETTIGGESTEWSPENFDREFHGPTTLRRALENSVNVVTVKLLQDVGVGPVIAMARQMGITSGLRREISLALGVSEVTPLELVSAYGVFANGGVRAEPFTIRKVTDSQGRVLAQHVTTPQEVMRPETAYVLVNVLKGVIQRGTGARARVLGRPLAGKTGTSSDATDVWFVGFTPSLVAGVWIGYDLKRSLGEGETGSRLALPIWINFMRKALAGTESQDFPEPDGVVPFNVDLQTGRLAPLGAPGSITEYFIEGTEPEDTYVATPPEPTPRPRVAAPSPSVASPPAASPGPVPFTLTPPLAPPVPVAPLPR